MYIVSQIEKIDETIFNSMYESNKTQLVSNIGFDNLDLFRGTFLHGSEDNLIFKAVNDSNKTVAYSIAVPEGETAYLYNTITNADGTMPLVVESLAQLLKSLNFKFLSLCLKKDSSIHTYGKNNMNRPELYEFVGEDKADVASDEYMKVKLKLL